MIPFPVMVWSGLNSGMHLHCTLTCSAISCMLAQSLSLENSMFVDPLPFCIPVQSSSMMCGWYVLQCMLGQVMSLFRRTLSRMRDSSIELPGVFSVRAYRLMLTVLCPFSSDARVQMARRARQHMKLN